MNQQLTSFGQWERGDLLYNGEIATVYLTRPPGAVIKWLKSRWIGVREATRRFEAEIDALEAVEHRNLSKLLHHGTVDDRVFLVTQYRGLPLTYLGRLGMTDALFVVGEVGRALNALHKKGRLVRNLSPDNILIDSAGNVTLVDLSFSTPIETQDDRTPRYVNYLAPEQARGEKLTITADQYALALITLELCTGAPAYYGTHSSETRNFAAVGLSPAEIRARMVAVGRAQHRLSDILLTALARHPEDRFPSTISLIRDVTRALNTLDPAHDRVGLKAAYQQARDRVDFH